MNNILSTYDEPFFPERSKLSRVVGLHLAGSNTHRSALVVLRFGGDDRVPIIESVIDRVGPLGQVHADDRLLAIFAKIQEIEASYVDSPLSLPPCGMCVLERCPGVLACADPAVAYLLRHDKDGSSGPKRRKRKLPANPQTLRLWDARTRNQAIFKHLSPSYDPSHMAMFVRTRALQKRLKDIQHLRIKLKETSIDHVLAVLGHDFGFNSSFCRNYRDFELGRTARESLIREFACQGLLDLHSSPSASVETLTDSLDAFRALITALVAVFDISGMVGRSLDQVYENQGWIYLPKHDGSLVASKSNEASSSYGSLPEDLS